MLRSCLVYWLPQPADWTLRWVQEWFLGAVVEVEAGDDWESWAFHPFLYPSTPDLWPQGSTVTKWNFPPVELACLGADLERLPVAI